MVLMSGSGLTIERCPNPLNLTCVAAALVALNAETFAPIAAFPAPWASMISGATVADGSIAQAPEGSSKLITQEGETADKAHELSNFEAVAGDTNQKATT